MYSPMVNPGSYFVAEDTYHDSVPIYPQFGPGPMAAVNAFLEFLSNVVDGAGQAARCGTITPSLNFFPSKTWTISSEPLSLRQRASA